MINASFISTDLNRADFQGADLTNALFLDSYLSETNFLPNTSCANTI